MSVLVPVPRPSYSQAREQLVRAIPPRLLCLLTCGGVDCRYEGPGGWKPHQQAIRGLFSSWVTDDIIAMARPSTYLIEKYNIIEQFHRLNIRSIINVQLPGEHAHCGPPIEPGSGFTYTSQVFMDNDVYFYNFGMEDFGVSSLVGMIDGVKVLAFAVSEGRVAVHCHAGLGRTGVLIACYLIYTLRISPSEAVHYVRIKRPRSIQTRAQLRHVFDFARLLGSQLVQYPDLSMRHGGPFSLQHYLNRQAVMLHGQEARTLRHTPKVVYLLCVHLSCLALGLLAPPEIQAELEKRSVLRTLNRTVRETLVSRQHLPLLREGYRGAGGGSGSESSWDEPLGFLERKREVLLDRRSYSDSDLSKIAGIEDLESSPFCTPAPGHERQWCVQHLIGADLRAGSPVLATLSPGQRTTKGASRILNIPTSNSTTDNNGANGSECPAKKALRKYSSNTEFSRNPHHAGPTSVARAVAKAMADHGPRGETVLQRSALLQEELNSSDCGWALLVTESEPQVLSCLLWTWLDQLREPVLSGEDVDSLRNRKSLGALKKPQRHTIYCLLSCVSTVTSLCPHREDAVLQRLARALTRHPQEEMGTSAALMKVLKASLRETFHKHTHLGGACSSMEHHTHLGGACSPKGTA